MAADALPKAPARMDLPRGLPAQSVGRLSGGRDLRLDLLRGWCIFSMVCDHAGADHAAFVKHVTGAGGWPMTGAHGFVLLSGTVMGLVYASVIAQEGLGGAFVKALRRGRTLYLVAIALGLLQLAFSLTPWGGGARLSDYNMETLVGLATLHHGADALMASYALLIFSAPLAFYLFERGRWYLVLAVSLLLWAGSQRFPDQFSLSFEIALPLMQWQLLFVVGLLVGYHRAQIGTWLSGRRRTAYLVCLFTAWSLLLVVVLLPARVPWSWFGHDVSWLLYALNPRWPGAEAFPSYDDNGPLHMLAIFVFAFSLFHLVDWAWPVVSAALGWLLIPLGQAALYVYAAHLVVVTMVIANLPFYSGLQGAILDVVLLAAMLLLWLMVRTRFLFRVVPR